MARSRHRDDDDDDRPRKRSRRRDEDDEDDEDEDEDQDEDDDDDDDAPRRKRRSRDDDDDEDDRPRKKRKVLKRSKKKAGGSGPLLLVLGLVGGLVVLAGGGFALWFFVLNETPEKAFADYKDAFVKKDYGRIYDRLDKEGQAEFDNIRPNPLIQATQSGKKGRELYIDVMKEIEGKAAVMGLNRDEQGRSMKDTKLESVTVTGDTATVTVRGPDGTTAPLQMVKQDGRWRVKTRGQSSPIRGR